MLTLMHSMRNARWCVLVLPRISLSLCSNGTTDHYLSSTLLGNLMRTDFVVDAIF